MSLQFDVYRNPSERTNQLQPYIMVIQHDYYCDLSTRLTLPLGYSTRLAGYYHSASPRININFQSLILNTPGITSVEKSKLKKKHFVCNLKSSHGDVISAIDALITNT